MVNFVCTCSRNGCHGNHAFFHNAIEFIFEDRISLHFRVSLNDLTPMKNCPGGGVQGRSN